ncbi:NAD-dependent malic enzyme 2 [Raphanus sativus]|nr:NAD-dependent malic enzyme 2 [Raphanus sativus]
MAGISFAEATKNFYLIDKDGLVTTERSKLDPPAEIREGASIVEVVKTVRPHVLLGLSGVGGIFNEEVLKAMRESDSCKLAIFAMSNPTLNAECTAADAFKHAGENIVFGSGFNLRMVTLGM